MRRIVNIPMNRVEGDIEIRVEVADGVITDAWSAGASLRGFERMLVGRAPLDGLVITPRICGMCSTAHLAAAVKVLDEIAGVTVPDDGIRLRNLPLMAELLQSDVRQTVLMFMVDFANPIHAAHPLYAEAVARFAPMSGTSCIDVLRQTKRIVEVIAIIGGQWPHSSFMVPGGVAFAPPLPDLIQCRNIVDVFRRWYEKTVLGCTIERWQELRTAADLDAWLDESPAHRDGIVGFLIRFGRMAGLDRIGAGHGAFLSYGGLDLPRETGVKGSDGRLIAAGTARGGTLLPFDPALIVEDVTCSWYEDGSRALHPSDGETRPYACGNEGAKYSWIKAPRYRSAPAETGPLAEAVVGGQPLFDDLLAKNGANALVRQLARIVRPATLLPAMAVWLGELTASGGKDCYSSPGRMIEDGVGTGLIEAARGALGHWVRIEDGRIAHYQVVTPTCWNGSPRDAGNFRGPWEQALIGTPLADPGNPVEAGYVLRSFDPCLVCAVHVLGNDRHIGTLRLGG